MAGRNWVNADAELDDLQLFRRALSSSEVNTIMNVYVPNDYIRLSAYVNNQWTFNQNLIDSVGTASLMSPYNLQFTNDRYGVANSAASLLSGYLSAPNGTYFTGDFSISAWVNLQTMTAYVRLMDFSPSR